MYMCHSLYVSVLVYGYATFLYGFEAEKLFINKHSTLQFGMAFYTAVAAVMMGLAAAIIYYLEYKDQAHIRGAYLMLN